MLCASVEAEYALVSLSQSVEPNSSRHNAHPKPNLPVTVRARRSANCMPTATDNRVLTWGVNDNCALGRDTTWEGRAIKALNRYESAPSEVDWSRSQQFARVAAGDSGSFALTADGYVYGWGAFRVESGCLGFHKLGEVAERRGLVEGLKDVMSIACSANTAFVVASNGAAYAWGAGELGQLGRRITARRAKSCLGPTTFGFNGAVKGVASIYSG